MKWMIASDLHGSAYYCRKMLEAFEREGADRLFLLGDLLYHGPATTCPESTPPRRSVPLLNGKKEKLLCVRGNCECRGGPNGARIPRDGRLCGASGGAATHLCDPRAYLSCKNLPPLAPGDVLLHGHTHVPAWTEFGQGNLYLNPGSVSIPKENSPHSYMTLEGNTMQWKELESSAVFHELTL